MMRNLILLATTVLMTTISAAQTSGKLLSIEDVVLNRDLTAKTYPTQWVGASDSYSAVEQNNLVAYDARTGKQRTLITLDELNTLLDTNFKTFPPYTYEDENSLVVSAHNKRNIINLAERKVVAAYKVPAGENLTRQSGKGGLYAYTRENNLYLFDGEKEVAVTSFADKNIVCGQSVSRNEFGISGGIFFSPDATKLAFYQKDESQVTEFPLLDITTRTGSLKSLRIIVEEIFLVSHRLEIGVYLV